MNRRKLKRERLRPYQEVLRGFFLAEAKMKRKGERIGCLSGKNALVIITKKRTPRITRATQRDWFFLKSRSKLFTVRSVCSTWRVYQ